MSYTYGKVTIICQQCEKSFEVYHSWRERKTCSVKCRGLARRGLETWLSQNAKKGVRLNTGKTLFKKGHESWNKGLKGFMAGEKNPHWQKENPSYAAVHVWINKVLGKPNLCTHCGRTDRKRYEWANVSRKYLREVTDWIRLCKSCHNIFDDTGYKSWDTRKGVVGL